MTILNRYEEGKLLYELLWCERCQKFVQQYRRLIFNTIQKTLIIHNIPYSKEDIEDLEIEVFIKLFENNKKRLWKYDETRGSSLACWIILITIRTVLNCIRDQISKQRGEESFTEEIQYEIDKCSTSDQRPEQHLKDQIERLHDAIKMLSSRDQLIIKLFFYDELPAEKCAYIIGISVNAFYKAKHDAIKRLKS